MAIPGITGVLQQIVGAGAWTLGSTLDPFGAATPSVYVDLSLLPEMTTRIIIFVMFGAEKTIGRFGLEDGGQPLYRDPRIRTPTGTTLMDRVNVSEEAVAFQRTNFPDGIGWGDAPHTNQEFAAWWGTGGNGVGMHMQSKQAWALSVPRDTYADKFLLEIDYSLQADNFLPNTWDDAFVAWLTPDGVVGGPTTVYDFLVPLTGQVLVVGLTSVTDITMIGQLWPIGAWSDIQTFPEIDPPNTNQLAFYDYTSDWLNPLTASQWEDPMHANWEHFVTPEVGVKDRLITIVGINEDTVTKGPGFVNLPAGYPALYVVGTPDGLVEIGNIDINHRPIHHNPDGTISTVRTISFEQEGLEILVPTVADNGSLWTDEQAMANYFSTGHHLGKFDSVDHADAYGIALHDQQAALYSVSNPTTFDYSPPATVYMETRVGGASGEPYFIDPFLFTGGGFAWLALAGPSSAPPQVGRFRHKQRDDDVRSHGMPRNHPTSIQASKRHGPSVYR